MEVSMTEALLSNALVVPGIGGGSAPGVGGTIPGFGGGFMITKPTDTDVGDIKMAARLDDHVEMTADWFFCDGRAISRATYAALFGRIGTNYGPGDGLTTFNIPRFNTTGLPGAPNGYAPIGAVGGAGYAPGNTGGVERHAHGMLAWVGPMVHTWLPTADTGFDAPLSLQQMGGIDVWVATSPHSHVMPVVTHGAGNPSTDDTVWIAPYLALGFFVRVN